MEIVQKFNIICVSKHGSRPHGPSRWHQGMTGTFEVITPIVEKYGVMIPGATMVHLDGIEYPIECVRPGLDGMAIVVAIVRTDEHPYKIWELYTDSPVPGSTAATVVIRDKAYDEIVAHGGKP